MLEDRVMDMRMHGGAQAHAALIGGRKLSTRYDVVCRDKHGNVKWRDYIENLVVTVGLNDSLDKHLKGSSYTAAWYCGLTDGTPSVAAGDTMGSHGGWTEVTDYDEANRQTLSFGEVAAGSVAASAVTFTISSDDTTIGGAFMASDNTRGGSTGTLYGGGAFTAGDKTLDDDDTLQVTITCTCSAS